jgi:fatty acid desaturase
MLPGTIDQKTQPKSRHAHPAEVLQALAPAARSLIRRWSRAGQHDPKIRRSNFHTQLKVLAMYLLFLGALAAYLYTGGHWLVVVASVAGLGLVVLPVLLMLMHNQSHWKAGNGPVRNWLLDHGMGTLFSVPQTGYNYGHLAHHRYDNDFDPRGFPKDLQSTYLFSRDGHTANIWLWCAFHMFVYQHAVYLFHVLNAPRRREILWYAFELALIVALHVALCWLSPGFYLAVYLPALLLGWLVAALSQYMMHGVDLDDFRLHPTLNSRHRLLNLLGNNDGYHIEHSLFPNLHPVFLKRVSDLIGPPKEQVLNGTYAMEALLWLVRGRPRRLSPAGEDSMKAAAPKGISHE